MRNVTLHNSVEGSTTIISIVPEGTLVSDPVKAEFNGVVAYGEEVSGASRELTVTQDDGTSKTYEVIMGPLTQILAPDGSKVKRFDIMAGDVVCELDSSALVDNFNQQQIQVTQAEANYEKAQKDLEIQKSTNDSLLDAAKLARTLADLDLEMYTKEGGEYDQAKKTMEGNIKQLEEQLAQEKENFEFVKRQAQRGYQTQNELESARIRVQGLQINLDVAIGELDVLEKFTKRRTEAERNQLATDTKREVERVQLEGEAALAQLRADLDAAKLTLSIESEKLERLRRQIVATKLVAPQSGQVVYASQSSRRSEPVVIEEGATVRERQSVIKLPDLTNMKVDARIHESRINRIRAGLDVEIRIDALPGDPYRGVLDTVSSVPTPGRYPNYDLKEYEAEVRIVDSEERTKRLKPGMSAEVTIIVDERSDKVLQIPIQSVVTVGPSYYAYVLGETGPSRRELAVGDINDTAFEIKQGIEEGERVIMNPKTHFREEIDQLEDQYSAERKAQLRTRDTDNEARSPAVETRAETAASKKPKRTKTEQKKSGGKKGQEQ